MHFPVLFAILKNGQINFFLQIDMQDDNDKKIWILNVQ